MKTRTVRVTPSLAMEWQSRLAENQRPMNKKHVEYLVSEMRAGRWKNDGSPIRFDRGGRLIDGQHRLAAVIASGVPVEVLVVEELDPDVFSTIDSGRIRKTSDVLSCAGSANNPVAASALLRLLSSWDDKNGLSTALYSDRSSPRTFVEMWSQLSDEVNRATAFVYGKQDRKRLCRPSVLGFAYLLFARISEHDATAFIDSVAEGTNLERGSGTWLLARFFRNDKSEGMRDPRIMLAVIIKAWNMWRTGRTGIQLSYRASEPYPIPQ